MTRDCRNCGEAKTSDDFYPHYRTCKPCVIARSKNGRKNHLRRYYGITVGQYDDLMRHQHGLCAICRCVCVTGKAISYLDGDV